MIKDYGLTNYQPCRVKGDYADDTLFDTKGALKETEYKIRQYCTCVSPGGDYPYASPEFNCELTAAMQPCRNEKTTLGIYTADCATVALSRKKRFISRKHVPRKKRSNSDYEKDDEEPPAYPMVSDDEAPSVTVKYLDIRLFHS